MRLNISWLLCYLFFLSQDAFLNNSYSLGHVFKTSSCSWRQLSNRSLLFFVLVRGFNNQTISRLIIALIIRHNVRCSQKRCLYWCHHSCEHRLFEKRQLKSWRSDGNHGIGSDLILVRDPQYPQYYVRTVLPYAHSRNCHALTRWFSYFQSSELEWEGLVQNYKRWVSLEWLSDKLLFYSHSHYCSRDKATMLLIKGSYATVCVLRTTIYAAITFSFILSVKCRLLVVSRQWGLIIPHYSSFHSLIFSSSQKRTRAIVLVHLRLSVSMPVQS